MPKNTKNKPICRKGYLRGLLATLVLVGLFHLPQASSLQADISTAELNILDNVKPELTQEAADAEDLVYKDSNTLTTNSDNFESEIPKESEDPLILGTSDAEELRYFNHAANEVDGIYSGNKIIYKDIWSNTDLLVTISELGVKEDIILKNTQAPTRFEYLVETVGLRLELTDNGGFEFLNNRGVKKFYTPAPDLTDASGARITNGIYYTLGWEGEPAARPQPVVEETITPVVEEIALETPTEEVVSETTETPVEEETEVVTEETVEPTTETEEVVEETTETPTIETPTEEVAETTEAPTEEIIEEIIEETSEEVVAETEEITTPETPTETTTEETTTTEEIVEPTEETTEETTTTESSTEEATAETTEETTTEPIAFLSNFLPKLLKANLIETERTTFENSTQNTEQSRQSDGSILRRYKLALVVSSTDNLVYPLDLDPSTFVQTATEAATQAAEEVSDPTSAITSIGRNLTTNNLTVRGTLTTSGTNLSIDDGLLYMDSVNNYVGIGKTNPATKLDVNGVVTWTGGSSTNANTAYTHSQSSSQAHSDYLVNNASDTTSGNITTQKSDPAFIFDTITAIDTDFWIGVTEDAGGDDDDLFQIGDGTIPGTNPFLSIDTNGYVGIGTTTPSAVLDVAGDITIGLDTTANPIITMRGSNNDGTITFDEDANDFILSDNSDFTIVGTNDVSPILSFTGSFGTATVSYHSSNDWITWDKPFNMTGSIRRIYLNSGQVFLGSPDNNTMNIVAGANGNGIVNLDAEIITIGESNNIDLTTTTDGNLTITPAGGDVTLDAGEVYVGLNTTADPVLNFLGSTNDGTITFDEDVPRFSLNSGLDISSGYYLRLQGGVNRGSLYWRGETMGVQVVSEVLSIGQDGFKSEIIWDGAPYDGSWAACTDDTHDTSTNGWVDCDSYTVGGSGQPFWVFSNGATDKDLSILWDGTTNDGLMSYMEDEDAFYFQENVGIGTTAPQERLDILGGTTNGQQRMAAIIRDTIEFRQAGTETRLMTIGTLTDLATSGALTFADVDHTSANFALLGSATALNMNAPPTGEINGYIGGPFTGQKLFDWTTSAIYFNDAFNNQDFTIGDDTGALFHADADDRRVGIGTTAPGSTLEVNGGITPDKVIDDPCALSGFQEGSIFYNDTANVMCYCNGTDDLKVADDSACF